MLELNRDKESKSTKQFELDMTLAFWFAVHLEDLPTAQALMKNEFILKQLVACALLNKKGDDEELGDEEDEEDEEEDEQGESGDEMNANSSSDWQTGKRKNANPPRLPSSLVEEGSFKSDSLISSIEKKGKTQFEGGDEESKGEDLVQVSPSQAIPSKVSESGNKWASDPFSNLNGPRKTLGQVLLELKRRKEDEEDMNRREEERIASQ